MIQIQAHRILFSVHQGPGRTSLVNLPDWIESGHWFWLCNGNGLISTARSVLSTQPNYPLLGPPPYRTDIVDVCCSVNKCSHEEYSECTKRDQHQLSKSGVLISYSCTTPPLQKEMTTMKWRVVILIAVVATVVLFQMFR